MAKIKDMPKFKRPREKLFERGPSALKDDELLAILLRTGYQGKSALQVANRILKNKTLRQLGKLDPQPLSKIKGVGKSRASAIIAALEFAERTFAEPDKVKITTPKDAVTATNSLANKKRERLVALYLNAKNELIKKHTVSIGTITSSLIHPREIFSPAVEHHAVRVVLIHNHPSGDSKPSKDDLEITEKIVAAGKILDIEVTDHIIIGDKGYFSFKEENLIP